MKHTYDCHVFTSGRAAGAPCLQCGKCPRCCGCLEALAAKTGGHMGKKPVNRAKPEALPCRWCGVVPEFTAGHAMVCAKAPVFIPEGRP